MTEKKKKSILPAGDDAGMIEQVMIDKLNLLELSGRENPEELLQKIIDIAEELTESSIGFFHFLEDDGNKISLQTWSTNTIESMCRVELKNKQYDLKKAGVWADAVRQRKAVIHNHTASLPGKKGMPEGHPGVARELVVPLIRKGKILAVLGVGNKQTDYTETDILLVSRVVNLAWEIAERRLAEENLRRINEELIAKNRELRKSQGKLIEQQEKLKRSEERFRSYIVNAPDGVFIANEKGEYMEVNPAACRITGYSEEELQLMSIPDLIPEEYLDRALHHFKTLLEEGFSSGEFGYITKQGERRFWVVDAVKLSDTRFLGFVKDTTERKKMETALKKNEQAFHRAEIIGRFGNWQYDVKTKHFWGSDGARRIYGFAPEAANFTTDEVESCIPDRQNVHQALIDLIEKGSLYDLEFEVIKKNNEEKKFVKSVADVEEDESGNSLIVKGVVMDITERKRSDDIIQKLLNEKEMLIAEVHHRIKNNMQTIASLLKLQGRASENREVTSALNDAGARLQSMMVLYDKLYSKMDFSVTSIREYLSGLVDQIISNVSNPGMLSIKKDLEDLTCDIKILQSVGIIINELLTNIVKHAFNGMEKGEINILLSVKDGQVTIIIADNGIGLPDSIDIRNPDGFGLRLVNILTEQIHGSLEVERNMGTTFILRFAV